MDNRPRHVVPATAEMAVFISENLQAEHRREILAGGVYGPAEALAASQAASLEAYAYVPDGRPLFIMGVEPASPITGGAVVWMLSGNGMERRPGGVLRTAKWGVARAFRVTGAAYLEQRIPVWYTTGLRFVERLGFALSPAADSVQADAGMVRVVINRSGKESKDGSVEPGV